MKVLRCIDWENSLSAARWIQKASTTFILSLILSFDDTFEVGYGEEETLLFHVRSSVLHMLQCVAVYCSAVQRGAECCRVLQSVAECCCVLQYVAVYCECEISQEERHHT